MYLDELFHYKNRLMKDLVENPRIIKLLQDGTDPQKKPEEYIYTQLYPFELGIVHVHSNVFEKALVELLETPKALYATA